MSQVMQLSTRISTILYGFVAAENSIEVKIIIPLTYVLILQTYFLWENV